MSSAPPVPVTPTFPVKTLGFEASVAPPFPVRGSDQVSAQEGNNKNESSSLHARVLVRVLGMN